MMCAGVQKVSRPIDMCQEMSQGPPIIPLTTPATMHQIVHGTDSTRAPTPARTPTAIGGLAMCCPKGIDCPIACNSSPPPHAAFSLPCRESTPHHPFCKPILGRRSRSATQLPAPNYAPKANLFRTALNFTELPRILFVSIIEGSAIHEHVPRQSHMRLR